VVAGLSGCQVWCEEVLDGPHMATSPVDASDFLVYPAISAPGHFGINSGHFPMQKGAGWVLCHPELSIQNQ